MTYVFMSVKASLPSLQSASAPGKFTKSKAKHNFCYAFWPKPLPLSCSQWTATESFQFSQKSRATLDCPILVIGRTNIFFAGQTLGFLCPPKLNQKNTKTEFGENRKKALNLSQQRGEHKADRSRTVCSLLHEDSRGLYKPRAHNQESVMRNKVIGS